MSTKPDWLPDMFPLGRINSETLDDLYNIFYNDFILGKPKLDTKPVFWDQTKKDDDKYEEGFWHLIEKLHQGDEERTFDPYRAEKLPWCAPSIMNFNDAIIKLWEFKESERKIKIYLWLEEFDYVIIFQKRQFRFGEVAFLLTAYHVDYDNSKRKLQKRYENRI
ncbi:MAG: hypothetical protein WC139_12925 [Candidatus Kapaibacterium sp.]